MEKLPPQNIEAEKSVLGAMLIDEDAIGLAIEILDEVWFYDDGDKTILNGCSCGSKLFFYIKKEKLEEIKNKTAELTEDDKKQIEKVQ